MKKLVVSKILLLSALPLWMACGSTSGQTEASASKDSKSAYILKKMAPSPVKGLVRLDEGQDLSSITGSSIVNDVIADKKFEELAAESERKAAAQPIKDEGGGNKFAVPAEEKKAASPVVFEEGGGNYTVVNDEGGGNLTSEESAQLELARKKASISDEGGGNKLGSQQLSLSVDGLKLQVTLIDNKIIVVEGYSKENSVLVIGDKDKVELSGDFGYKFEVFAEQINMDLITGEKMRSFTFSMNEKGEGSLSFVEDESQKALIKMDGVEGAMTIKDGVLFIDGKLSDSKYYEMIQELVLVANSSEKFGIKIDAKTLEFHDKFEINKEEQEKLALDLIAGSQVQNFLFLNGLFAGYKF